MREKTIPSLILNRRCALTCHTFNTHWESGFERGGSRRDAHDDDLGHVDDLLGNKRERVEELELIHQLFHHQRHRSVKRRTICSTVCPCTGSYGLTPARRSGRAPPGSSSKDNSKSSGWRGGVSQIVAPCSSSRSPPPRSCPSSDLVRCGASSQTGPWRRSAVHTARTGVTVAPVAFERRQRVHHRRAAIT